MTSPARKGLNRLLAEYPSAEVARVFHQDEAVVAALREARRSEIFPLPDTGPGSWTTVDLFRRGAPDEILSFAIWNATGKVYRVDPLGAVEDDPFL